MSTSIPPRINYTKRQFADVRAELLAFIQANRSVDFSDFNDSNLGIAILEMAAFVADLVAFGQDITAQELFLATARRYDSALRFARSVGYVPRSAKSATVVVKSGSLPTSVV